MKRFCFFLLIMMTLPVFAFGDAVHLSGIAQPTSMGKYLDYFEDPAHSETIDSLLAKPSAFQWHPNASDIPNMGYTSSTFWFRLKVDNDTQTASDHLIEIGYPMLNKIEYYLVAEGKLKAHLFSGSHHPYHERTVAHRNFVFELDLEPGKQAEIYLKVRSESSIQVPIVMARTLPYFEQDQMELINKTLYYGMMLVMVLYNLFLFFSLREIVYIYYVAFVSSLMAVQFCLHGFSSQYFWPDMPHLQDYGVQFLVPSCVLFASLFTRKFLHLSLNSPYTENVFKLTTWLSFVSMTGAFFFDYSLSIRVSIVTVIIASITCLFIGPYLWSKGHQHARFYSIAWLCIALTAVALALSKLGIIPRTYLTENGLQIGAAAEAVLLSLALADRLNREKRNRFAAEAKLVFSALHHPTTHLPNRAYLINWLEAQRQTFDAGKGRPSTLHIVLIHLHRFHEVNKTLGHQQADRFLTKITRDLSDFVQSIPGIVCLEDQNDQQHYISSLEGVRFAFVIDASLTDSPKQIAKLLVAKIVEPIEFDGMLIAVGGVAGTASYSTTDANTIVDSALVIRHAQIALDHGRKVGKSVMEYTEAINPYNARRLNIAGELRQAMLRDELELYFQPKVDAKTKHINSMEALLRWQHPVHGFIPPDEFIPIAEQAGLINALTLWVVDHAIDHVDQLNKQSLSIAVAVNISAINLKDRQFPESIREILKKYHVKASQLSLEVTETAMMDDPARALDILKQLNAIGIRLSIDDFGTGYSSLAYIKQLSVQEIKIDRSFVMEMDNSKSDAIIVQTTVNMCHDLSLEVVAEGVETETASASLQKMGCDYLQGYYFSRPLPFKQLVEWLKGHVDNN